MRADRATLVERARSAPRRAARSAPGSSASSWPRRIAAARPAGPPPTIATPTSMRSSAAPPGPRSRSRARTEAGRQPGRRASRASYPSLSSRLPMQISAPRRTAPVTAHAPVDLRSDTVTRPTPGMREAMATAAVVGDDVYGDDPDRERARAAGRRARRHRGGALRRLGHDGEPARDPRACRPGRRALRPPRLRTSSRGGGRGLGALGHRRRVRSRAREAASTRRRSPRRSPRIRIDPHHPVPRLLCLENTFMMAGGSVIGVERARSLIASEARRRGLAVHLDGARLFERRPSPPVCRSSAFAATADTMQFCLSKGLGTPVGSMLCGSGERTIARARRLRKMLGGGWRQAGVLAAAGIYALDHHVERLADDHRRARELAEGLAGCDRRLRRPAPPSRRTWSWPRSATTSRSRA